MASVISPDDGGDYEHDQALEGERCRNCGKLFHAGDPVILAIVPAGYEVAYCSVECLNADRKGGAQ